MLKLIDQNIVVLGSLNPVILHPNWLCKIELLESGKKVDAKMKVGSSLPTEFTGEQYKWSIDYSRLQVGLIDPSKKSSKLLSKFIYKVFKELKHTPVTSLGENFAFEIKDEAVNLDFLGKSEWGFGEKTEWGSVTVLQHHLRLSIDEVSHVNVSIGNENQTTTVKFNFHYDVKDTDKIKELSNEVESNLNKAEKILVEILKK